MRFSISHILENICIAQDILENMNTTQDALSGTGHNVYSFALMFRLPGLHSIAIHIEAPEGGMLIKQPYPDWKCHN